MFEATISNIKLLTEPLSSIAEIIDEGVFKITKEGICLAVADRAVVAAVDFRIFANGFEQFKLDEEMSMGLNIGNLLSILKRAGPKDKVTFRFDGKKLEIIIKNSSKRRFVLPLLEITQEELAIEQLKFTAKAELKPDVLQSGIEDAELITDSVVLEISPSKFLMRAESDVNTAELELEKGSDALLDIKTEKSVSARYPLDYLRKMIKTGRLFNSTTIELGQDFPMKMSFKLEDKLSLSYILAPRVEE